MIFFKKNRAKYEKLLYFQTKNFRKLCLNKKFKNAYGIKFQ